MEHRIYMDVVFYECFGRGKNVKQLRYSRVFQNEVMQDEVMQDARFHNYNNVCSPPPITGSY